MRLHADSKRWGVSVSAITDAHAGGAGGAALVALSSVFGGAICLVCVALGLGGYSRHSAPTLPRGARGVLAACPLLAGLGWGADTRFAQGLFMLGSGAPDLCLWLAIPATTLTAKGVSSLTLASSVSRSPSARVVLSFSVAAVATARRRRGLSVASGPCRARCGSWPSTGDRHRRRPGPCARPRRAARPRQRDEFVTKPCERQVTNSSVTDVHFRHVPFARTRPLCGHRRRPTA